MAKRESKLYEEQELSLNSIRKELGLDKMYLYRYAGNYEKIMRMPYDIVVGIARVEGIEPDVLFTKMKMYALKNKKESGE